MSALIPYQDRRSIDEIIEKMFADRLVCSYLEDEHSEPIILDMYRKRVESSGGIPNFSDVTSDIEEYNHNIFYEGAIMKYEDINGNAGDAGDAENVGNEIYEIACNYEDDSKTYGPTANLNFYIEFVLCKYRQASVIEPQDEVFNRDGIINIKHMRDVKVIVNDCQSLLFPEFVQESVAGYCDFANYYKQENGMDILLLGG